jgi:hypothetical protein
MNLIAKNLWAKQTVVEYKLYSKAQTIFEKSYIKIFVLSLISGIFTIVLFYRFGLFNIQDPNANNYNGIGWFLQNSDAGGWLQCAERLAIGDTVGLASDGFTQWCLRRPGYVVYLGTLIKIFGGYSHLVILFQLYIAVFSILLLVTKVQKYSKLYAILIIVYFYKIFQMFGGSTLTEMLGIPAMALAVYLLIVACEKKKMQLFGLALFAFVFASNSRPFNSLLPFLIFVLVVVLLKKYSMFSKKSFFTMILFFSIGLFFFETWNLIGYTDANHGLNSWVSIYSFVKGDATGWSVAYRDFPNVNGLSEIEYFKMIQHEAMSWFLNHPFDWISIFFENIKTYLGAGGTYAFLPSFQAIFFAIIVISILNKSRERSMRSVSFVSLAVLGSNVVFAGILWPNEGQRISIPTNILVLSLIPLLNMFSQIDNKKQTNELIRNKFVNKSRTQELVNYALCVALILSSLTWTILPRVEPSHSLQKSNNLCGINDFQMISIQILKISNTRSQTKVIPLTLDESMTINRNSIQTSLSEGDSRFFLGSFPISDYQIQRMLFVSSKDGHSSGIFGIDTKPSEEGCWEPITNMKISEESLKNLLNIGVTHFSKK